MSTVKNVRPVLKEGIKKEIGIVSLSTYPQPEYLEALTDLWVNEGFDVYIHPQNYERKNGLFTATPAERAKAFMQTVRRKNIAAIHASRGGIGSFETLCSLNFRKIKENPVPYIGFSDFTGAGQAITKKCHLVTFYGPMGWNFAQPGNDPRTGKDLMNALYRGNEEYTISYNPVEGVREGSAEGRLVVGHLNRMQLLIGTPYDPFPKREEPIILGFETVETTRLEVNDILTQLRYAGKLKNVKGILVGEMLDVNDGETTLARADERSYGKTLREIVVEKHIEPHLPNIPIAYGIPFGHGPYMSTQPNGDHVHMEVTRHSTNLTFGQ